MGDSQAKESTIPLGLVTVGAGLLCVAAWREAGPRANFGALLITLAALTSIRIVVLLLAAFVTAKLIGVSFGPLVPALVKFAALFVFPSAVALAINVTGLSWVAATALWFILLVYLFEIDTGEALIFTGVIIVLNFALEHFLFAAMGSM